MDSAHLLVVGENPECAEQINSLLHNSGIDIHTKFAHDLATARTAIDDDAPVLLVIDAPAGHPQHLHEILRLAAERELCAAVRISPDAPQALLEALACDSCIGINRDDDEQLARVVRQQLRRSGASHERADSQQDLDELGSRYHLLLDSTSDAVAYIHEGLHVSANKAYLDAMQLSRFDQIAGLSVLELMSGEQADLEEVFSACSGGQPPGDAVGVTVRTPAGAEFKAALLLAPTRYGGEPCIQVVMRRADPGAALQDELERLRSVDPLTQLSNRKAFTELVARHIEDTRESGSSSAVVYLEPDNTGMLLRDLGVAGMDSLVADLAEVVQRCIGPEDLPCRFSDFGFAVLLRGRDTRQFKEAGTCIVQSFGNHIVELGNKTVSVSCSAGMTTVGALTHDADEALSQARLAQTEAAQSGNCLLQYKPQLVTVAADEEDQQWVERIKYALNNGDLYSTQQSIVNLEGDAEGLFESRTFMRTEEGDRSPEEYMPAAEQYELASTLDRQVIPGLLKAISGSADRHVINVSGNSLLDFSFPSWFEHQLAEQGVMGSQVVLQFTAEAAARDPNSTRRLVAELERQGCAFSISNFDDQEHNRRLLGRLRIAMLKLKPGLTRGITGNQEHLESVRNVVFAADRANVQVIADEVRDAADMAALWQCGVKLVAGEFLKEALQVVGQ
jgi:diguanylate cyclase (GGDEF)-like protein